MRYAVNQELPVPRPAAFHDGIRRSLMNDFDTTMSMDDYVDLYNSEMQLLDIHAPQTTRTRRFWRHDSGGCQLQLHHATVQVDIVIHGHRGAELVHQRRQAAMPAPRAAIPTDTLDHRPRGVPCCS